MADNANLTLDIVTPTGPVKGATGVEIPGVEVPGVLGELGVLPQHVPFVSPIVPGVVRFREGERSVRIAVGRGFLEVSEGGRVTVLADRAVTPEEVDQAAVQSALQDVQKKLDEAKEQEPAKRESLMDEQAWLEAQLRAAGN